VLIAKSADHLSRRRLNIVPFHLHILPGESIPAFLPLRNWKNVLELRFEHQAIYVKLSERAIWL
jgi:hypothetical protein